MTGKHVRNKKKQTLLTKIFKSVLHAILNINFWVVIYLIAIIASITLFISGVFPPVVFGGIMIAVIEKSGAMIVKLVGFSSKKH